MRMFKNIMWRRMFGPKREEMAGGWRRLHNEELYNFCASPNFIRVIKFRRMWWSVYGRHEKCIQDFSWIT
jgi:hypothetical protein